MEDATPSHETSTPAPLASASVESRKGAHGAGRLSMEPPPWYPGAEGSWTMEETNERMLYGRTFGTDMGEVRWDIVGDGLGCQGAYVDELGKLQPALDRAKAADGPSVICIRTNRDANLATPPDALLRFVEVYQGPMG